MSKRFENFNCTSRPVEGSKGGGGSGAGSGMQLQAKEAGFWRLLQGVEIQLSWAEQALQKNEKGNPCAEQLSGKTGLPDTES